jgi:hypothetical protein
MTAGWTAYWIERFRPVLFVPAAILVAAASRAGIEADLTSWMIDIFCALLLLGQFRLWDDLADRGRDRAAHPSRVLVRAARVAPFVATCLILATLNVVLAAWLRGASAAAAVGALDIAAAAWYRWRPARRTAATDLILLSKYPALVLSLAVGSTASLSALVLSAAAIYGLACAFEIWHDASGPLRIINS